MHHLLAQQLKQATATDGTVDLDRLLADVSRAYDAADRARHREQQASEDIQSQLDDLRAGIQAEADARFNAVMKNVGEAVITIDMDGRIETFNRTAEEMFGYDAVELVGHDIAILTTEERASRFRAALTEYAHTGDARPLEALRESEGRRKDGDLFPAELAIAEVQLGGRPCFVGVIRDISAQVETERQLRESEGRFRDLVGSASDWFWETDADGRLTFVSERISNVLGVKASAIVGATFFDLGLADDGTAAKEYRQELAERRSFRDRVFHVGPPEGHDSRVIRISGIPILDRGEFVGYRGVGVDVTREVAAERRARQAQQLLADAIERIVDGLAVYDAADRLVLFNPEYRRVFAGMSHVIKLGVHFEEVVRHNPAVFDTEGMPFEQWVAKRLQYHRDASGQPFVVRMADGRWILHREFRMADGGTVGLRTDISELKRREQELESLRRLYRLILDAAGEGIVGLDRGGRVIFANRSTAHLLGYPPEQMVGQDFHALVQPFRRDGTPCVPADTVMARAYGQGAAGEVSGAVFHTAEGASLPVDYYAAPIDEDGGVSGAVVVFRDATLRLRYERTLADSHRELERLVAERTRELTQEVSNRARIESSLRESRERLKGITDSLFEGVVVVDRHGRLSFANPSARALLALDGDPEGLPIDAVLSLDSRGRPEASVPPWTAVLEGGENICDNDAVFVTADGRALDVAYGCTGLRVGGEVKAVVISFRDISPLKAAQREALQSSRMASVGQLAAGIAHEINTPIQYIGDNLRFISESIHSVAQAVAAGRALAAAAEASAAATYAETLANEDVDYLVEEIPRAVDQSLEGVGQVARIVLSMKEFSHPGSSSKTMVDINRALDNTVTVARNTWKHVAEVVTDYQPDLPPVPCYAGELNQVFLNIIVNAAHAIEAAGRAGEGRISIATSLRDGSVSIRLSDNGTGIADDIRDKIFDPFFTTKDVGKGTGQGLAISRDVVVVKHGGRIEVESRHGRGTVFTVLLPVAPPEDDAAEHWGGQP
ncbi:MAG: PAS domain S-box protein [Magnetospirillum sp.]|nr:PAS domain S-box protein [Magnetospirillum sp.]